MCPPQLFKITGNVKQESLYNVPRLNFLIYEGGHVKIMYCVCYITEKKTIRYCKFKLKT